MSVAFNGTTSKLQHNGTLSISYPFSVFCWVKNDSAAASGMVFGVGQDGTPDNALFLYADGAGTGNMRAFARDNGAAAASSTTSLTTGWLPALAVFASASSRTIYYGAGAAVTDTASISPAFASIGRITVGCRNNDTLHFDGEIAHAALWSDALTQTDFDALAGGAVPSTVASGSLYDYWALATATATHTGANGRVLTAFNTTTGASDPPVGSDTTAPTLTSPTGVGGLGVCSGTVSTDEGNGTLYAVATASATAPSAAQVKAGQDHTGSAALRVVSQAVSATGTQTVASGAITGGAGTRFWHFVHTDTAGNDSNRVSSAGFDVTASATQLVLSVPDAAGLSGFNGIVLSASAPGAGVTVIATPTSITFNGSGQATINITGLGIPVGQRRWVSVTNSNGDPAQSPAPVQAQGPVTAS